MGFRDQLDCCTGARSHLVPTILERDHEVARAEDAVAVPVALTPASMFLRLVLANSQDLHEIARTMLFKTGRAYTEQLAEYKAYRHNGQ